MMENKRKQYILTYLYVPILFFQGIVSAAMLYAPKNADLAPVSNIWHEVIGMFYFLNWNFKNKNYRSVIRSLC